MKVPDHAEPIRVNWYWVDEPPPGLLPTTVYGSTNWESTPNRDWPLGEIGYQRNPWLDWYNGNPPPFPQTVPVGLAVGLALAAGESGRVGLGSGLGVGLSAAAAGYTRSLAATGNGAGLGVAGAVESRVSAAAGLGLAGGVATRTAGLAEAFSGLGSGEGSASPGVSREVSAAGLASALATVSSLSCRSQSGAGTATGVGTVSEVKGGTPACGNTAFTPYQVKFTIAGVTNGSCTDCSNANGDFVATYAATCQWNTGTVTLCTFAGHFVFTAMSGHVLVLSHSTGGMAWNVTLGANWDGRSSVVLSRVSSGSCLNVPLTVTVSPA